LATQHEELPKADGALMLGAFKQRLRQFLSNAPARRVEHEQTMKALVELGRTLSIIRQELMLVYERPAGAPGAAAGSAVDPQIFRDYIAGSRLKEVYATDLFPSLEKVTMPLGAIHEETQHPNQVDLLYVAAFAKARGAKRIFEFGTYQGRTTYHLTLASEEAHVTTLNLPPELDPSVASFLGIMYRESDRAHRVTQLLCDSRAFDPAPYAKQMDYIFIDGDHSYELVQNDTEKALAMLAPGGMMIWHDYAAKSPGVVRCIREFSQSRPVFRIKHTCLVAYLDGVDATSFQPLPRRKSWLS
jgi:predicted O-methyltransferase YrrM